MNNLEKIAEMLNNDPELLKKLEAESKRLTESGKKDIREITAEAVKAIFGTDLTDEELDQIVNTAPKAAEEPTKLGLDALDDVAGGEFKTGEFVGQIAATGVQGAGVGALAGCGIGSIVPGVGNVVGAVAGALIGAVTFGSAGACAYIARS